MHWSALSRAALLGAAVVVTRTPRAIDASYTVTLTPASRELVVEASLSSVPSRLVSAPGAPATMPDGWATFIKDLKLTDGAGDIPVTRSGAGWIVARAGASNATLRYRVVLEHDDTLPNGEPRWVRDRTMSEVGYVKEWGVFLTARPLLVLPDPVTAATLTFRLPPGWSVGASWERDSAGGFRVAGPNGLRPGMFAAGTITTSTQSVRGIDVRYVFAGASMQRQAPRIERAVTQSLEYFITLMRRRPEAVARQPLSSVLIVLADEPRKYFVGGGLISTNISMLVPPDAGWQLLEGGVAHELFHLWNGRSFGNLTPGEAWFSEGVTEWFSFNALRAAGAITEEQWRGNLREADRLYRADSGLGRLSMTAAGPTKFAHRGLTYMGGYVAAACLDADIRRRTAGRATFDDVIRAVFDRYTLPNRYDTRAIARIVSEFAGADYTEWFARYVEGTEALPADACGAAALR